MQGLAGLGFLHTPLFLFTKMEKVIFCHFFPHSRELQGLGLPLSWDFWQKEQHSWNFCAVMLGGFPYPLNSQICEWMWRSCATFWEVLDVLGTRCRVGSHTCSRSDAAQVPQVYSGVCSLGHSTEFLSRKSQTEMCQPRMSSSQPRRGWVDSGAAGWQEYIASWLWRQYLSSQCQIPRGNTRNFH